MRTCSKQIVQFFKGNRGLPISGQGLPVPDPQCGDGQPIRICLIVMVGQIAHAGRHAGRNLGAGFVSQR